MEMGGIFFKNLELYPPPYPHPQPLQLGSGEYIFSFVKTENGILSRLK